MKTISNIVKKNCQNCGGLFVAKTTNGRPVGENTVVWRRRKYCSKSCSQTNNMKNITLEGHAKRRAAQKAVGRTAVPKSCKNTGKTHFKKGAKTWNTGLKGYRTGEMSHLWKGGITPENQKIRSSMEYKLWRTTVFQRDGYACVICGSTKSNQLNADHIKPFALFPELRLQISNGRTLCVDCHKLTPTYMNRYMTIQNYGC